MIVGKRGVLFIMFFSRRKPKPKDPGVVKIDTEMVSYLYKHLILTLECGFLHFLSFGVQARITWTQIAPAFVGELPKGVGFASVDTGFDYIDADGNIASIPLTDMEKEYAVFYKSTACLNIVGTNTLVESVGESGIVDGIKYKYLSFCALEYRRIIETIEYLEKIISSVV